MQGIMMLLFPHREVLFAAVESRSVCLREIMWGLSIAARQGMEGQGELLRWMGKICLKN